MRSAMGPTQYELHKARHHHFFPTKKDAKREIETATQGDNPVTTTYYIIIGGRIVNAIDTSKPKAEVLPIAQRLFGPDVTIDENPPRPQLEDYPYFVLPPSSVKADDAPFGPRFRSGERVVRLFDGPIEAVDWEPGDGQYIYLIGNAWYAEKELVPAADAPGAEAPADISTTKARILQLADSLEPHTEYETIKQLLAVAESCDDEDDEDDGWGWERQDAHLKERAPDA